ncbi:hypothetical protein RGUI_4306 (plasmid) [Rhodovulum sp. P5]|uniref:hypothetical protein n=1 Tax=Rhodovulum sp. P5 TaxID=1564506 RepID=UPI0009C2F5EC|nr:hypothetical protein [Rhodovulum sp. P5]ARE42332.1 hypothetical protein RGUI_4306 [Rhodovulum sp. P5]
MPDDPHIVLAHSDDPVNWDLPVFQPNPHRIAISPGKPRFVRRDGDTLIALEFDAPELEARWAELRDAGARWEGAPFVPRILLGRSDQPPPAICFFSVPILFGPEWRATPDCLRPGGRGPAT